MDDKKLLSFVIPCYRSEKTIGGVVEEINSYYLQKRSVKDIAHSLRSRLDVYVKENYN